MILISADLFYYYRAQNQFNVLPKRISKIFLKVSCKGSHLAQSVIV